MLRTKTTAVRLSSGHDGYSFIFDIVFPDYDTWKTPFIVIIQPFFLCLIKNIAHCAIWVEIMYLQNLECRE